MGENDATGGITGVLATLALNIDLGGLCFVGEKPAEAGGMMGVEPGGCIEDENCLRGDPKVLSECAEGGR